jgi:ribosomal protein S27E
MNTGYNCPNCGNKIKILDAKPEQDYDCPTCGTTLVSGAE